MQKKEKGDFLFLYFVVISNVEKLTIDRGPMSRFVDSYREIVQITDQVDSFV